MSPYVIFCYEDDDVDIAAQGMADAQVRRLAVMSRDKRLVGILSLGDIATRGDQGPAGDALQGVSQAVDGHLRRPLPTRARGDAD